MVAGSATAGVWQKGNHNRTEADTDEDDDEHRAVNVTLADCLLRVATRTTETSAGHRSQYLVFGELRAVRYGRCGDQGRAAMLAFDCVEADLLGAERTLLEFREGRW